MDKLIESLSPLEREVLPLLKKNSNLNELMSDTKLSKTEVTRALQWLDNKAVIKLKKKETDIVKLDSNGEKYIKDELPERKFLETLKKESKFKEVKDKSGLDSEEFQVSLGILKSKMAIEVNKGKITLTNEGKKLLKKEMFEEEFLKKIKKGLLLEDLNEKDKFCLDNFRKRKQIVKVEKEKNFYFELNEIGKKLIKKNLKLNLIETITPKMLERGGALKLKKFRRYDIKVGVPKIHGGRRHFVNEAKSHIKKIWLDMGFKEMKGNLIQSSFWNFDALFVPQDHPAREMQDTFFVSGKKSAEKEFINKVKKSHEDSWKYKWDSKEAEKLVLRTHTTVLSAKTISGLKKEDLPAKFFAVGKNFRNEAVDWSHLFELIQVEGIVIDEKANFRNLIGYLKEFFGKMGFEKVRVRPAFFPYTEPSAEVDVYHPIKKKWIELGGAGIFRPEVVKPLLGKDIAVLAWGLGLERTILDYYKIKDIRDLYKNDIKKLKGIKAWV